MEQNTLQYTGVLEHQYLLRQSPAGVAHQDIRLLHRSRQMQAGQMREVKLSLVVHLAGNLVEQAKAFSLGQRLRVTGFLAQASYRDNEQVVLQAQTIEIQD